NPALSVIPDSVSFGTDLGQATLTLRNGGAGLLTIQSVAQSAGSEWLTVTPSAVLPAAAPVNLALTVSRTGLTPGQDYTAMLTVTSSAGSRDVPIAMRVPSTPGEAEIGDVGKVYVLLLDPDTRQTMAQTETTADADYAWAFADPIPVGRYILIAGTDRDN